MMRLARCHSDIRWKTCCARPRTFNKRLGSLMRFYIRKTARIRPRNYSIPGKVWTEGFPDG